MTTAGDPAASFQVPVTHGRQVYLREVMPEDYRFLRAAELSGELGIRWRFRGSSLSPERWIQSLWQSVLVQHVVVSRKEPTPLGLALAYRPSFQDGHVYIATESFRPGTRSPLMIFGSALFIEYVFRCWNFHKLYFEVAEYNLPQFHSGIGKLFEVEGRLRDHFWYDGRRWDQYHLALYREAWERESKRILRTQAAGPPTHMRIRMPPRPGVQS
jgi:hypothetical protein